MRRIFAVLVLIMMVTSSLALAQGTGAKSMSGGAASTSELSAVVDSGVPEAFTEDRWQQASGAATIVAQSAEQYTVRLEAKGLVPDGLYTTWYVIPGVAGSAIGQEVKPAGGLPNEFRADADGNAVFELEVPVDNDYRDLVVAYHADDMTHGEVPGEMGGVTFAHLMADFPALSN